MKETEFEARVFRPFARIRKGRKSVNLVIFLDVNERFGKRLTKMNYCLYMINNLSLWRGKLVVHSCKRVLH